MLNERKKLYKKGALGLLSLLGLSLGACTTTTGVSSRIQLSAIATPPSGLVAFCADVRAKCHETQNEDGHDHTVSTGGHGTYYDTHPLSATQVSAALTAIKPLASSAKAGFDRSLIQKASFQPAPKPQNAIDAPKAAVLGAVQARKATPIRRIEVSADILPMVRKVNQQVNELITWKSDQDIYGLEERWTMPLAFGLGRYGDCEDFALEKRRLLLDLGVPAGALALATTTSKATGSHALLVIRTTQGDYVLDNTNPWVMPWAKTDYQWITIQESENLLQWRAVASREEKRTKS